MITSSSLNYFHICGKFLKTTFGVIEATKIPLNLLNFRLHFSPKPDHKEAIEFLSSYYHHIISFLNFIQKN